MSYGVIFPLAQGWLLKTSLTTYWFVSEMYLLKLISPEYAVHCSLDTARWTFSKIINLKLPTLHIIGWHNLHAVFGGFKIITRKWFIKIINSNVVCLSWLNHKGKNIHVLNKCLPWILFFLCKTWFNSVYSSFCKNIEMAKIIFDWKC